ncbi:hypothetical protein ALC56_06190 [Trachymyrmex septentrionalis]|uniref:Uncharacterized protein n=1 Tax=Trachymyrmex septentrionalis TaxID=34720 RepID=A0A195FG91_9HYME|nr:hypothetical protein ALC56_06190 [Trachymyrmex septentrionalis]
MADDGPSAAEDATAAVATGLGDGDSRVTRERHKRADATTPIVTSGQDASIEVVRSVVAEDDHDNDDGDGGNGGSVGGVDSDCDGDSAGSAGSSNSSIKSSKSGAGGVAAEIMTGGNNNNNNAGTRVGVEDADGTSSSPSTRLSAPSADSAPEVNDREDRDADRRTVIIAVATKEEETTRATEESPSASASASASAKTDNAGVAVARHQGSPFKGQVRMAEDTLVGPCGKKRCADRYDSSESSDR